MYEVGSWFIYMLDGAILALVGIVAMIAIFIKRGQYQKQAVGCIRAEIQLATGWSEFYTIPCDMSAKSVTIGDFLYTLNPDRRRWGRHPMNPFMGLSWLQVPIRIETWYQDVTEPMRQTYDKLIATSTEIKAMTREIQATTAAMQIQEIDARQKELTRAITNQPNKVVIYILAGAGALFGLIDLILLARM